MSPAPKVCVVMSTYNAQAYLAVQIDSILAQTDVDVRLHVRDDGSTDGTLAMLSDYAARDSRVSFIAGPNLKPLKSFMTALESAVQFDSDYFAFSDADDYWMPDKLISAVRMLSRGEPDRPRLLSTAWTVADAELRPVCVVSDPEVERGFRNALVQCQAGGHTIVMNRSAGLAIAGLDASRAIMHDGWVYLVISALGEVLYDPTPHSLYRQHGGNFDGAPEMRGFLVKLRDLFKRAMLVRAHQQQAASLLDQIGGLGDPDRAEAAETFLRAGSGLWPTLKFALGPKYHATRRAQLISAAALVFSGRDGPAPRADAA